MNRERLDAWLREYGRAWERKDTKAFTSLFSDDVVYHWTPFEEPKSGRSGVALAFDGAVARQSDIRFEATILGVEGDRGIVHWRCAFDRVGGNRRVHLDGIFLTEFDDAGLCRVFREWWHSDEPV